MSDEERAVPPPELDVLVVGAGFSGLYALQRLRDMGRRVHLVDDAPDVGGVWHWNRYPGARCDIESVDYCYSFSDEIVQEWTWTERYPAQPEILRYLNFVADRMDLRRDISFGTRVQSLTFDDSSDRWTATTDQGDQVVADFVIMATGQLSKPQLPDIEGFEDFAGELYHTGRWPPEGVDTTGKTVGVIGTGSSGVQAIPQLAKDAGHLYVFQRTAHYAIPANNRPLDPDFVADLKSRFGEYREQARHTPGGTHRVVGTQAALDVDPGRGAGDIRGPLAARRPRHPGLLHRPPHRRGRRRDRRRLRPGQDPGLVRDPETAEKLCPRGYPFGSKRLVLEIGYYETFNRDNVTLVDVRADPIEQITATASGPRDDGVPARRPGAGDGLRRPHRRAFEVDIKGVDGRTLREAWADGPQTYLGVATHGFPNLFFVAGAGLRRCSSNVVLSIEQHVEWITDHIEYLHKNGLRRSEAGLDEQRAWVAEVHEIAVADAVRQGQLLVPRCQRARQAAASSASTSEESAATGDICEEVAADGYRGFATT